MKKPYVLSNIKAMPKLNSNRHSIRQVNDGWQNAITNLGILGKDKNTGSFLLWSRTSKAVAQSLFASDDIAGKIAKIIPLDSVREGITWKIAGDDDNAEDIGEVVQGLDSEFERLQIWSKLYWGQTMGRVYGGAIGFISLDDGMELDEEVNPGRIRKVNAIHIFDRWDLNVTSSDLINDISDPMFGLPEFYNYYSSNAPTTDGGEVFKIHHSRVIRFDGEELPTSLYKNNNYWSDSIYGKLYNAVRNYSTGHDNVATILSEINQPLFKIEGLHEASSQDQDDLIVKRIQMVNQLRSTIRAVVLDKEDEFENMVTTLPGVKDLIDVAVRRLIAASDIPHTRLMGESPGASLGEAGKSEQVDYFDMISAWQETRLRMPITKLTKYIFLQTDPEFSVNEPKNWTFEFDPLFQQDQKEIIETRKLQADIDNIYMQSGVYDSFETAESRFGSGEYSYETQIEEKERAEFNESLLSEAVEQEKVIAGEVGAVGETSEVGAVVETPGAGADPASIVSQVDPTSLLNGAQVTALLNVIEQVTSGSISKAAAIAIIKQAFGMDDAQVNSIMASIQEGEKASVSVASQPGAGPKPEE